MSRLQTTTLLCVVAIALSLIFATGCGWKGEPVPEHIDTGDTDTAYNDLTYTAVTGNATVISAIAANLKGYINTSEGYKEATQEVGFLISREKSNPMRADADNENAEDGLVKCIKIDEVDDDHSIKTRIFGLIPFTRFYFRTYAIMADGKVLHGVAKSFMTQNLTISLIDPPTRIGLFDADLAMDLGGLASGDYGTTAKLYVRCADATIESPTSPISEAAYDTKTEASATESETRFSANVGNLTPGQQYSVMAYVDVVSDFYNYDTDNPCSNGVFKYGVEAQAVRTDKFKSNTISLAANALTGIRAFTGESAEVDYDKVLVSDCYFTLPSDTLDASEYGIMLSTDEEFAADSTRTCTSGTALRTGNRYDISVNNLRLKTTYYYKAYVIVRGVKFTSQTVCTFSTKDYTPYAIDLGLSVQWADKNVGAWSKSAAGAYYAWGEVSQKDQYTDETFAGAGLNVTSIGGTAVDIATVRYGDGWRLPTPDEVTELFLNCTWKWTTSGGVYGYEITGDNENKIFIPACGFKMRDEVEDYNSTGYYWTSERGESSTGLGQVIDMYFREGMKSDESKLPLHTCNPALGLCIRAVYTK